MKMGAGGTPLGQAMDRLVRLFFVELGPDLKGFAPAVVRHLPEISSKAYAFAKLAA